MADERKEQRHALSQRKHGFESRRGHQNRRKRRNRGILPLSRSLYPSLRTKDAYKVIRMTAPFKDPRTSIYYFRKAIPPELRPAFGKREYKVSLGTRDPVEAKALMPEHAAAYERLALNAKAFLRGGATAQANHYVERWLQETRRDVMWLLMAARKMTSYQRLAAERGIAEPAPDYVFEPEVRYGEDR